MQTDLAGPGLTCCLDLNSILVLLAWDVLLGTTAISDGHQVLVSVVQIDTKISLLPIPELYALKSILKSK